MSEDRNPDLEVKNYREHIRSVFDHALTLKGEERAKTLTLVEFAYDHNFFVSDPEKDDWFDVWGFGRIPKVLYSKDDEVWVELYSLSEATGLTRNELHTVFEEFLLGGEEDVKEIMYGDSPGESIFLVSENFVVYILHQLSPWADEFRKNTQDLFILRFYEAGLADNTLAIVREDSLDGAVIRTEPLSDYIERNGIPDEDEALRKAHRGPSPLQIEMGEDDE